MGGFIRYLFAKKLGENDTSNAVLQRTNAPLVSEANGSGGQFYQRSMLATSPAGIVPFGAKERNDIFVTGDIPGDFVLQPLTNESAASI